MPTSSLFQHTSELEGDAARASHSARLSAVPISRLTNEMSEIREIAEGSFGVVRSYRHDFDNQEYAVKQSKRPICGESNLQQQLQEIYALSSFPHRHIVRYFDGWVEDRAVFVRLEKLDDSVATLPTPVDEAVLRDMLYQIGAALYELHAHGVVHMDVKPENILTRRLDANTILYKLCDFGLARPLHGKDMPTGELFLGLNDDDGDRRFMSPESLKSLHDVVGTPADVYALGKSCEAMMSHAAEDYPANGTRPWGDYSAAFAELVESMIDEDPSRRPTAFHVVQATMPERLKDNTRLRQLQSKVDALRCELEESESSASDTTSALE